MFAARKRKTIAAGTSKSKRAKPVNTRELPLGRKGEEERSLRAKETPIAPPLPTSKDSTIVGGHEDQSCRSQPYSSLSLVVESGASQREEKLDNEQTRLTDDLKAEMEKSDELSQSKELLEKTLWEYHDLANTAEEKAKDCRKLQQLKTLIPQMVDQAII
ncbi:hypothetical protein NE237_019989 [Protea cynaroides]|uniref:Uncharacterized protein n=1 Tax=Protea cynaroides TaxID=273540 RepID=A0A9Q0K181_9MAGN|nr:hypothetical protein NE237_019989 [Protea cynaroides]